MMSPWIFYGFLDQSKKEDVMIYSNIVFITLKKKKTWLNICLCLVPLAAATKKK